MSHLKPARAYSRSEYLSDAIVHAVGLAGAVIGGPIAIGLAVVWGHSWWIVASLAIYTVTLIAMWVCSGLFNLMQCEDRVIWFRQLDQSAIYLKIAGTYTPFIALASSTTSFFLAMWLSALAGVALIMSTPKLRLYYAIPLYLGMGWAGAVFGGPLLAGVSSLTLTLLVIAGLLYSSGVVFTFLHRLRFHNTIWHLFVLVATTSAYMAVVVEVARAQ